MSSHHAMWSGFIQNMWNQVQEHSRTFAGEIELGMSTAIRPCDMFTVLTVKFPVLTVS